MTRPALLVPVSVRMLAAAAARLALGVVLTSCGDAEEENAPGTGTTSSPTPTSAVTSPTPLPATTTVVPAPTGWGGYVDPELGFSFPRPPGLSMKTDYFDIGGKDGGEGVRRRTVSFARSDGVTAFGVGVEPNPWNLSLEEWARKDGWPSEPEQVAIGGEKGLLFPVNEMGDKYPVVSVAHGDMIYTIGGNVFGVPGAEYPAGISEADFQSVLAGFRFGP